MSYQLDGGDELPGVHQDQVQAALDMFEAYGGSTGPNPQEAMARALVEAKAWEQAREDEDRAHYLRGERHAAESRALMAVRSKVEAYQKVRV